ncbi:MAG: MBL fold metallo-hydrolase [Dehalococcoidia bacterium]
MTDRFEIVFLGTGSPLPSAERCGAGNVVVAGDRQILVDCGWGAARRLAPSGVRPAAIDTAVFTHMHTDHITDFPDFLFQRWTGGAVRPLQVYGPEGTRDMVDGFLLAMRRDIGFRLAHHGDKLHPAGITVDVTEVPATATPAPIVELDGLCIESFEVDHFPVVPAFGYRFRFGGQVVVLSGDTSFCTSLLNAAQGADMLVCEAMNAPMFQSRIAMARAAGMTREADLLDDVPSYHIDTQAIAQLARDAGVGEVVLSHIIPPISTEPAQVAEFVSGMHDIYAGSIRVAHDTLRLPVTRRRA